VSGPSLEISRDIMDIYIENIWQYNRIHTDPRLLMELSDRCLECIGISVTMSAKLEPFLKFFVQYQEYFRFLGIGDEYRSCDMSIPVVILIGYITISIYQMNKFLIEKYIIRMIGDIRLER
jgi:hypothetical protein